MSGTVFAETLTPKVLKVQVTERQLILDLEDGRSLSIPLFWYPRLVYGTENERQNCQISGAGFGIHWPDLDEDIGIKGLLDGKKSAESEQSFQRWLKSRQYIE